MLLLPVWAMLLAAAAPPSRDRNEEIVVTATSLPDTARAPGRNDRVEPYSEASLWSIVTGSRMRRRSPNPRVEYLDLTQEPATAQN